MKIFKLELAVLLVLTIIFSVGKLQINFGLFNFSNIVTTLSNPEWQGAPYIVKELNTINRSFEDGEITFNNSTWDLHSEVLDHYPTFMASIYLGEQQYHSNGKELEVCLTLVDQKHSYINDGLFGKEIKIYQLLDSDHFFAYNPSLIMDNYIIEFECNLKFSGLATNAYIEKKIKEFQFLRSLELLKEYTDNHLDLVKEFNVKYIGYQYSLATMRAMQIL